MPGKLIDRAYDRADLGKCSVLLYSFLGWTADGFSDDVDIIMFPPCSQILVLRVKALFLTLQLHQTVPGTETFDDLSSNSGHIFPVNSGGWTCISCNVSSVSSNGAQSIS